MLEVYNFANLVKKCFSFFLVEWWFKALALAHDMGMSWLWWGKDILWQLVEMMVSLFQCIASFIANIFGFFFHILNAYPVVINRKAASC